MNFKEFTKEWLHKLNPLQASIIFNKVKWSQEKLVNGMLIEYDGDAIDKSSVIYQVAPDGAKSLLPDGQYKTKDNVLFVLTDGKVSSVEDTNITSDLPTNDQPIKQAQSSETIKDQSNMNLPIKKPLKAAPAKVAPVKAEEMASDVAAPADDSTDETDETDDASEDATSVQEILEQALAPITAALQQIIATIGGTTEMAKETKTELSKVKETVTKLAEESAPEKKETKEVKNHFSRKPFVEPSESRSFQILKNGFTNKK